MLIMERFWAKVEVSDSTCWEWTAGKSRGYGGFWVGEHVVRAHRFLWEQINGVVPEGLELDHLCRNRRCVNPSHLEIVTHLENVKRGMTGQYQVSRTHCPQGQPYDKENTYSRPNGTNRECRTCTRQRNREYKARQKLVLYLEVKE